MPEYAEVKLQRDNINAIYDKLGPVSKIEVYNTNKRVETDFSKISFPIHYHAETRGKELKLVLRDSENTIHNLAFGLGMSGSWVFGRKKPHQDPAEHIRFVLQMLGSNSYLGLHDVRRFAHWKFRDFKKSRSPDPVEEYDKFKAKIERNIDKSKKFEKPIAELLLDQSYFNGIGNYLRSTILYHTDQNPFQNARDALKENKQIIPYCRTACRYAYNVQKKIGDNNNIKAHRSEQEFMSWKFYKKGLSCKDGTRRTLWFDEEWEKECPYEVNK